ncbi:MAG: LysR family transcriptional regulator [Pseudomonadota bacterium]
MRVGPLKVKAQLFNGDEAAIGPGRALLLEAIAAHGSISAAARATGISYRKCWLMVDAMNRLFAAPLVDAAVGGGRSRGARLTAAGDRALAAFRALEARIAAVVVAEAATFDAMLRKD